MKYLQPVCATTIMYVACIHVQLCEFSLKGLYIGTIKKCVLFEGSVSTLRMFTHLSSDLLTNHATSLPYMYIHKYWLRCVNAIKIQF